jgi:hypothetical protein
VTRRNLPLVRTLLLALVVMTSAVVSGRATAEDVLVLAGGVRNGTLAGYADDVCRFDDAAIPRASIYFIGLDAKLPPPQPQDPLRDEVHLRDGSVHPGHLLTIDGDTVVTETASHTRKEVAWIWLTPTPQGQAAPQGQARPPATAREKQPTYTWDGTIHVENRYDDARHGRHHWQAEYRIKLLEVDNQTSLAGPASGPWIPIKDLEPQQLDYEIQADQTWLREPLAGVTKTITMHGTATGRLSGADFTGYRYLKGTMTAITAPLDASYQPPHAFASYIPELSDHYHAAQDRAFNAGEPGWYFLEMRFKDSPYAETRALYAGIERGGTMPLLTADPDQDFVFNTPNWMPDITYIAGRLEHPEQADVRGGFTLRFEMQDGAPQQIAVEWSFTRTRQ